MSHCWLKSPRPGLLPVEENEQCGTAKYRADFPGISSRSPERKQTRGGLGDWRHSRHKQKPDLTGNPYVRFYKGDGRETFPLHYQKS